MHTSFKGEDSSLDLMFPPVIFSPDHCAGVQLFLRAPPCPLLPHHPGVPPPPPRCGGVHAACRLFPLLQPRPDAPAEPGEEDSCHQALGHSPGGLHRLFHALSHPPGAGLLPGQGWRGGARSGGGARARLSHHGDPEQPQQLPGSSGLLLCDGQLQEGVEDKEEGGQGGRRGGWEHKWRGSGEELGE